MRSIIENFASQFKFIPKIVNAEKLPKNSKTFVVAGMGGSALAAELIRVVCPSLNLFVHKGYSLPEHILEEKNVLFIGSSYSGNTEETISATEEAIKRKLPTAVVSTGGKIIEIAKKTGIAYVEIPNTHIQPRMATGFNSSCLLTLIAPSESAKLHNLSQTLKPKEYESLGQKLGELLENKTPIVYSSLRNYPIAYNWKIKFNENTKIPAFANAFPELNHNEMTGFDIVPKTKALSQNFHFLFLKDFQDNPRILKRMGICQNILEARDLPVTNVEFEDGDPWLKIFRALLIADWASFYLAKYYGNDPEQVPMVEEFKKLIK